MNLFKKNIRNQFNIILLLLICGNIYAQFPTVGDCLGAIPVCDPIYEETDSPVGPGNYTEEINVSNCVQLEKNSVWYIFTVQNTGDFGFILTPNDLDDDYDWSLFNLTGKSCEEIESDASMTVSCNAAGGSVCNGVTGADGSTIYNFQNFGCGQNPPVNNGWLPLNALVPVEAGNTYALLIINWSGSPNGYTLDFSQSAEVGIFDQQEPEIVDIDLPAECGDNSIEITFSENITCESFDAESITIDGPGGPYSIGPSSANCIAGGQFSSTYTIYFDPPFEFSGDYTISFDDSPTDLCLNPLIEDSFTFSLEADNQGVITTLDSVFCGEFQYEIDAFESEILSYEWQDGSTDPTFFISNSGLYSVDVQGPCFTRTQEYNIIFQGFPIIENVETEPDACMGNFGEIIVTGVEGSSPFTYSLDDINYQTSTMFTNLATGMYTVYVHDQYGCEDSIDVIVDESFPNMSIDLISEATIKLNESFDINATIVGDFIDFYWTGDSTTLSCVDCLNPTASPLFTTSYFLHALDESGCEIIQEIIVRVIIPRDIYFPNTFSPNNDNVNDRFTIASGLQLKEINSLSIYSRWGELIYKEEDLNPRDPSHGWDGTFKGKTVNPGVYSYLAEITYVDDEKAIISGSITVIK